MKKTKTGHLLKAGIAALAALLLLGGCSGGAGGSDTDGSTDMPPDRPRNNGTATESVYDLGAVGDGKTDDSAAFAASGDGWLRVPAGRYRIAKKTAVTRKLSFEPGAVIEAEAGVAITFREVIEAGESYQIIRNGRAVMEKKETTREMLGMIFDNATMDLGDTVWMANIRGPLCQVIESGKGNFSSRLASLEMLVKKNCIQTVLDYIKKRG